jgi:hypothetical protein
MVSADAPRRSVSDHAGRPEVLGVQPDAPGLRVWLTVGGQSCPPRLAALRSSLVALNVVVSIMECGVE